MSSYVKDPGATLDYSVDWSKWLASGETITSHAVTVPTGIDKTTDAHTSTAVTYWLSGGTAGQRYAVTCQITTSQGRTDERTDYIDVRDR